MTDGDRYDRAVCSLQGLSVGDALGERFFITPAVAMEFIERREVPPYDWRTGEEEPAWYWTDDTNMAISILECLRRFDSIDQDWLAADFAGRYDGGRGYGPSMHGFLRQVKAGADWRTLAQAVFEGKGSYGNGAAMRVGPLGAYFADDLDTLVEQTVLSASVTHTHPEAIAGAIAIAAAAALAFRGREKSAAASENDLLSGVLPFLPRSEVRAGIEQAHDMGLRSSTESVSATLGNGSLVSAMDTVPFALWCAQRNLDSFEEAIWNTVSALGDRDTTCAIVGSIVSLRTGAEQIPAHWLKNRERLPAWI